LLREGEQCDDGNRVSGDGCTATCEDENDAPDCSAAAPRPCALWPPNHALRPVEIEGIVDPDGDRLAITVRGIRQDEPIEGLGDGHFCPDGAGVGTASPRLRVERAGSGNGRVYHVAFTASDGRGGLCSSTIQVCVPHDRRRPACIDEGPLVDSTGPCP
jgi:cysteine-rich repeat protein